MLFLQQKRYGNFKQFPGKFKAELELWTSDQRKRKDADNRMKIPLDFCTRISLILDDKYCEEGTFRWINLPETEPDGCQLTLTDLT